METKLTEKAALFSGEVRPRTVQDLRAKGYIFCIFTDANAPEGLQIFEDIDGAKIVAYVPAKGEEITAGTAAALFTGLHGSMPDLPVYRIEGCPDDTALTYPVNGILHGTAPMDVNAANIALREMTAGDETVLVLVETAGRETAYELYCEAYDFGFRALFGPYEAKRFVVDRDGGVSEIDFLA